MMKRIADAVHVTQSRFWQTNSGVIVQNDRAILIDAGIFPDELVRLAKEMRGQTIVAGLSTHEDWDHVLWAHDLGTNIPRYSNPVASRIVTDHRAELLTGIAGEEQTYDLRWDHDLIGRLEPVAFGPLNINGISLELHYLPGHTEGNSGFWLPEAEVAFVGDTLSDIDPPVLPADRSVAMQYPQTLDRLRELILPIEIIVPGHGAVCDRNEALQRLELDARYLDVVLNATIGDASGNPATERPPRWMTPACNSKLARRCICRTSPICLYMNDIVTRIRDRTEDDNGRVVNRGTTHS